MFATLNRSVKFQALHILMTQGQALFYDEAVQCTVKIICLLPQLQGTKCQVRKMCLQLLRVKL